MTTDCPPAPLRIAFYAPLKSPRHPVPSGDRLMARLLFAALERAGHEVTLVSELRAFLRDPGDRAAHDALIADAAAERARIAALWARAGAPDAFFCYHPYYKSPDLIGPPLARAAGIPWISAEASVSARRDRGLWQGTQDAMRAALAGAAVNLCLTRRDLAGLRAALPDARLAPLAPFIALPVPPAVTGARAATRIVTVAMMRAGDKLDSYRALAETLRRLPAGCDWQLSVAGDGPARDAVRALFADLPPARIDWRGELDAAAVARLLQEGAVYLWPGCGEAYGLAYLEAQAAGLPVVAWATAGVPEVVAAGETGILTAEGDHDGLAQAVARLLGDADLRERMGAAAQARVRAHHALPAAAARLDALLRQAVAGAVA
ncbi:glycosyltransferase family 4 protein [Frigidibacter sp. MR17.24]|uniref:glycosyltransferase family 4 protein n=1 Tax=Frigidibacter sp. MR17.24 TaxID=3127345 RepID=UPI0030130595